MRLSYSAPLLQVLCISPTRELAQQIEAEGRMLLHAHGLIFEAPKIMSVVGGTNIETEVNLRLPCLSACPHSHAWWQKRKMAWPNTPDVLVATPGRLIDHLKNHGGRELLSRLKVLIFDGMTALPALLPSQVFSNAAQRGQDSTGGAGTAGGHTTRTCTRPGPFAPLSWAAPLRPL